MLSDRPNWADGNVTQGIKLVCCGSASKMDYLYSYCSQVSVFLLIHFSNVRFVLSRGPGCKECRSYRGVYV